MIPDWETNCVYLAAMLQDRHPKVFNGLQETLTTHQIEVRLLDNVRDVWAVDYCPVQVADRALVKFTYAPDYLRGHEEIITGDNVLKPLRNLGRCHRSPIVLDGGNVVGSHQKAIL